jgi:hypothetical protein
VLLDQTGDDSVPQPPSPPGDVSTDAVGSPPEDASGGADATSPEDAGDASSDGGGCASPPCERFVFVTSLTYNGDLGGISGADEQCNALAASGDPRIRKRSFVAYLGSLAAPTQSGGARIQPMGRVFRRLDGALVADNRNVFLNGPLKTGIDVDENNTEQTTVSVWTGLATGGIPSGVAKRAPAPLPSRKTGVSSLTGLNTNIGCRPE